mgnify:CR=1 FL=1
MEESKMKVMFIIDFLGYGGASKMLTEIANNLSLKGFDVKVYGYASNSHHYNFVAGVEYIQGSPLHSNYYLRHFLKVPQVIKMIRKIKPNVIISFMPNPNVLSIIGTRFTNIPVIISERGDPSIFKGIIPKIKYFFYNFADVLVCQTEGAKSFFNNRIKRKSIIIPNSVTIQKTQITPIEQRRKEIAFVGRFQLSQKRQDLMVLAFKEVVKKHPEYKLVFYGDGDDIEIVKNLVRNEGLSNSVIFAGKVDNVIDIIKDAGIFVLTSDYEGIPNALIEAMCLGLPVVSTDCSPGGARLLIENNINGIIVPRGNVQSIANAVNFLIENPSEAQKMGANAQNIIERFSPEKICSLWEKVIKSVIK